MGDVYIITIITIMCIAVQKHSHAGVQQFLLSYFLLAFARMFCYRPSKKLTNNYCAVFVSFQIKK